MSGSEKPPSFPLVLVCGSFMMVACVLTGVVFFFISRPPNSNAPVSSSPSAHVTHYTYGSRGKNVLTVNKVTWLSPGLYEVNVVETDRHALSCNHYRFRVNKINTEKTDITVKSQPTGDPLSLPLETSLLVKTKPDQKSVQFVYTIWKKGPRTKIVRTATLTIDLTKAKAPTRSEGKRSKWTS